MSANADDGAKGEPQGEGPGALSRLLDELARAMISWMLDEHGVWTRRGEANVLRDGTGDGLVDVQRPTAEDASMTLMGAPEAAAAP